MADCDRSTHRLIELCSVPVDVVDKSSIDRSRRSPIQRELWPNIAANNSSDFVQLLESFFGILLLMLIAPRKFSSRRITLFAVSREWVSLSSRRTIVSNMRSRDGACWRRSCGYRPWRSFLWCNSKSQRRVQEMKGVV